MAKATQKQLWERKIRKQCKEAGTYKSYYEDIISTLAEIMVVRDHILEEYIEGGRKSTLIHTNKAGASNVSKNPLIMLWDDYNKTALAYWRELGLSPSALKKITGESGKKPKMSALAEALNRSEV